MASKRVGDIARVAPRLCHSAWLACLVMTMLPIATAQADSGPTSDQVAQEILRLQGKADDAAQAWSDLDTETATLADEIVAGQAALGQATEAFTAMQTAMAAIAVSRFMGGGLSEVALLGDDPVVRLQKDALSNIAIGAGDANLDSFETLQADLENKQADLASLRQRNDDAKTRLVQKQQQLDDQLAQLAALEVRLKDAEVKRAYEAQLGELRAKEKAAADKTAAKAAARSAANTAANTSNNAFVAQTVAPSDGADSSSSDGSTGLPIVAPNVTPATTADTSAATPGTTGTTPAQPDPAPPTTTAPPSHPDPVLIGGSWLCPVAGPNAFGRSFGDPRPGGRLHQGVDMISPFGTPLVAVVAGFAQMKTNSLGGNAIGLKGGDGNYYYYAHLSSWEGPSRDVQAGEVIGYVGHTGDTSVDHLHFEIHPGGGNAVDPYDTLRSHC